MTSRYILHLFRFITLFLLLFTCMTGCEKSGTSESKIDPTGGFGPQVIKHTDKLYDVSTAGNGHVWVVGYFGTVFHSSDSGLNWSRTDVGTKISLLGVHFIDEKSGWIVGDQGMILHTDDGGDSWDRQTSPVTDEKLLKVQFIDQEKGWIVGTYGLMLHTENGGKNWERLPFEEDVILNDLCFINSARGWLAGEFGLIFYTEDGGRTWVKQLEDEMGRKLFGLDFADHLRGVAVGNEGVIYTTINGGKDWVLKGANNDTLLKVAFADEFHATAVGLRGCLTFTEDGGDNWRSVCPLDHFTWLSGIAYDKSGRGFAVGDGGKILISVDSGLNWVPYYQPAAQ
jgi:photosystem II stability/assembly factor-like uncharacterized protein